MIVSIYISFAEYKSYIRYKIVFLNNPNRYADIFCETIYLSLTIIVILEKRKGNGKC